MSWTEEAVCLGEPEPFFPKGKVPDYSVARWICQDCPVRTQCAAEVMRRESEQPLSMRFGFQGGMSPEERHALDPRARHGSKFALSEEGQALRLQLYREGASDGDIADRIARTEQQVRAWRLREKLPANEPTDQPHYDRRKLYEDGLTDGEIARKQGVTRHAIRSWRVAAQLRSNAPSYTSPEPVNDARFALWQQGFSDVQIAEAVGRTREAIRKWRNSHGLKRNEAS